jgi:capsular polysaccharide biosynthesis protein
MQGGGSAVESRQVTVQDNDEVEIDLLQIYRILLGRLVYILLAGIVAGGVTLLVSIFIIPAKYESQAQLYIINRQNDGVTTYSDIQSSTQLVNDYKVLVTSRPVLEKVISTMGLEYTVDELDKCISADIETDSRVLEITVTTKDPYLSKSIVDSVATVSAEQIQQVMQIEGVNVIQYGQVANKQSSPKVRLNTAIAFVAGIVVISGVFIFQFQMDDSIKSSDDIEKYLGTSTLALIPYAEEDDDGDGAVGRKKKKEKKKKKKG